MNRGKKRCLFVLATPDYEPEMCSVTLPNLKAYADKLHADFFRIQERKYPDFPINYERLQIHELGRDYDWCISMDADFLVRPDIQDFTEWFPPSNVGNWWYTYASQFFYIEENKYFMRDGRDYGIVDNLLATSWLTHEFWEPLPGKFSDYLSVCKDGGHRRISEYCLSQNVARYGLKVSGIMRNGEQLYHLDCTSKNRKNAAELARKKLIEWGVK